MIHHAMLILCVVALLFLIYLKKYEPTTENFTYPQDSNGYDNGAIYITNPQPGALTSKSIMQDDPEKWVLDFENRRCKHVTDNKDYIEKNDLLKNYRFLNHPTDDNACYLKMGDTLVDNKCNKFNKLLYNDTFKSTVTSVKTDTINDPYVAETLTDNICKVTFNDSAPIADKTKYVSFMNENDPKVTKMHAELTNIKSINDALSKTLEEKRAIAIDLKNVQIPKKDTEIQTNQAKIEATLGALKDLDNKISERDGVLNGIHKNIYHRDRWSTTKICSDANFGNENNCGSINLSEYDTANIAAHRVKNDKMSSIWVPPQTKVTLYADGGFRGSSKVIEPKNTATSLGNFKNEKWDGTNITINDKVSSLKFEPTRMFTQYYS